MKPVINPFPSFLPAPCSPSHHRNILILPPILSSVSYGELRSGLRQYLPRTAWIIPNVTDLRDSVVRVAANLVGQDLIVSCQCRLSRAIFYNNSLVYLRQLEECSMWHGKEVIRGHKTSPLSEECFPCAYFKLLHILMFVNICIYSESQLIILTIFFF